MVGEKEELPLRAMQANVRIDGFRARVFLDLYYYNDRPQQFEGSFQLRLPEEASPYFFAFGQTVYQAPTFGPDAPIFFKPEQVRRLTRPPSRSWRMRSESWIEPKTARIVPREKAAVAYRDDGPPPRRSGAGRVVGGGRVPVPRLPLGAADAAPHRHRLRRRPGAGRQGLGAAAGLAREAAGVRRRFQRRCPGRESTPHRRPRRALGRRHAVVLPADQSEAAAAVRAAARAGDGDAWRRRRQGVVFRRPAAAGVARNGGRRRIAARGLPGRRVAGRPAAVCHLAEAAPQRAGGQSRSDRAVFRALFQRRDVLVAGAVRDRTRRRTSRPC